MKMFEYLKENLRSIPLTMKAYSQFLGITEKALQNKMNGTSRFTLPEIEKTSKYLFPNIKVEKLFFDQEEQKA